MVGQSTSTTCLYINASITEYFAFNSWNLTCTLRFERSLTKCWEFRLSDSFTIGWICETENEGGDRREINTKIERGVSTRASRKEVNQIGAVGGGERKEDGQDLERAWYSHALYAGIGNCQVVEIACEWRSSLDKETWEGA